MYCDYAIVFRLIINTKLCEYRFDFYQKLSALRYSVQYTLYVGFVRIEALKRFEYACLQVLT